MINFGCSGQYKIQVMDKFGKIKHESDWFDNLITDRGLDLLGQGFSARVWVGTGDVTPQYTDVALSGAILGSTTSLSSTFSTQKTIEPYYVYRNYTWTFTQGSVIGTIKEVGIGAGTSGNITSLFSRALIPLGSQITLTSIDQLIVIYQFRWYFDLETSFTIDVNGINRNCIARPMRRDNNSYYNFYQQIGIATTAGFRVYKNFNFSSNIWDTDVSGTRYDASSVSNEPYILGSYTRNFTGIWLPDKGEFTVSGCTFYGAISIAYTGPWTQVSISPGITKTQFETLTLNGKYTWSRYAP